MELDLRLARSFLVLVEERHFGRAAARLHLTSSALTKQVQRLEREVGAPLLERGPVGVQHLTLDGRRFAAAVGPLITHADAVRASLLTRPGPYTVRVGFPAGSLAAFAARIPLTSIARNIHRSYPEATLICREVDFAALDTCLPDRAVDVLWNSAPVESSQVDSFPLPVTSGLVGLVPTRHALSGASSIDVATFADQPILYSPIAPDEWMRPFWLADIRPRREARLIETFGNDHSATTHAAAKNLTLMTTVTMDAEIYCPPHTQVVELLGARRLRMHAARRRSDHRGAVAALIEAFQKLPADTCP